jgi:hypothetical protein
MRSGRMRPPITAILLAALPLCAAQADERRVMVTSFDRIRVEGPFTVEVKRGASPRAVARGDARALDQIEIRQEDRTLVVRGSPNGWGGWPGERTEAPRALIETPTLVAIAVTGAGAASVDALRGAEVSVALTGSGRIDVAGIEADRVEATTLGSGALSLAGSGRTVRLVNNGVGTIDAAGLSAPDVAVISESAGPTRVTATRTANVVASGTGSVVVSGPAACTRAGPAPIDCGD